MPFRARPDAPGSFTACLTSAGAYLVHARLGSAPLAGWPRVVHIAAGPSDASRRGLDPLGLMVRVDLP